MILKEISTEEAKKVLFDKEILSRVASDNAKIKIKKGRYIGGYVNDKLIGVVCYYDKGDRETVHINVLKPHRAKHGLKFGRKALKLRSGKPLFTNIQSIHKDVIKYAIYNNFKLWNIVDEDKTIDGQPYKTVIMRFDDVIY